MSVERGYWPWHMEPPSNVRESCPRDNTETAALCRPRLRAPKPESLGLVWHAPFAVLHSQADDTPSGTRPPQTLRRYLYGPLIDSISSTSQLACRRPRTEMSY